MYEMDAQRLANALRLGRRSDEQSRRHDRLSPINTVAIGRPATGLAHIFAIFYILATFDTADAVGEIELKVFHRLYGSDATLSRRCAEPSACLLTVCARPLTVIITPAIVTDNSDCALGVAAAVFRFQRGAAAAAGEAALQLRFAAAWEGTFALDVRILDNYTQEILVSQTVERADFLAVARDWTQLDASVDRGQGSRLELSLRLRVKCARHFYGRQCTTRCEPTVHYDCAPETGARRCRMGWRGADCGQRAEKCAGVECANGDCNPETGACVCRDGYRGDKCDQCVTWAECKGRCTRPYECLCPAGRGGPNCDKDMMYCAHNSPCLNGGICANDGNGSYTCACAPGFTGRDCQRRIDSCEDSPCRNSAACVTSPSHPQGFVCRCPSSAHGRYCQSTARRCADQPCANNASCFEPPPAAWSSRWRGAQIAPSGTPTFECRCARGWAGSLCDTPANWCASDKCFNGGTCVESASAALGFACRCAPGFVGARCEWNINDCKDQPCQNNGTCVDAIDGFRCECRAGFVGAMCQHVDESYSASLLSNESRISIADGNDASYAMPSAPANAKFVVGALLFISALLLLLVACVWHLRVHLAAKIQQQQSDDDTDSCAAVGAATVLDVDDLARQKRRLNAIGTTVENDQCSRDTVNTTTHDTVAEVPCGRCHVVPPPSYAETFGVNNLSMSTATTERFQAELKPVLATPGKVRSPSTLRKIQSTATDGAVTLEDFETLPPLQFQSSLPIASIYADDSVLVDVDEGFASDGYRQSQARRPNDRRTAPHGQWPSPTSISSWSSGA